MDREWTPVSRAVLRSNHEHFTELGVVGITESEFTYFSRTYNQLMICTSEGLDIIKGPI
jgi:hypothetical protein